MLVDCHARAFSSFLILFVCVAHALRVQELYEDGGSDGQRANAHALRGLVFATLGKDAEALKDLDAQIKLQPDRPPALGTCHAKPCSAAQCSAVRCCAVLAPVPAHAFGCAATGMPVAAPPRHI
jgi:hypothetical protein